MTIIKLSPQLANQIAAGEVVERPASVIKELVENSLDAGATQIDIEIEKGGSKLIRIRDNGAGIAKGDLSLALSRHATSKLTSFDDLNAILSFGFRGEALASISSVSRLTLTSNTLEQDKAWQAQTQGIEMAVKVLPAAHPVGTSIEVVDLFFNTPARRRFLKSDKTEFTHIDEWLKRIVLVRKDVHFTLKHNGKMVRHYRRASNKAQFLQRLGQVCGKDFAESALSIDCEHGGLVLSGYLQSPEIHLKYADVQYFYVNGRLIRDRLVTHAVRQAFNELDFDINPNYVLMLTLDPAQVDVNVHPAKHEVRFHQSRYVHDFLLQALQSALNQLNVNACANNDVERVNADLSSGTHSVKVNESEHTIKDLTPTTESLNSTVTDLNSTQNALNLREYTASVVENNHNNSLGVVEAQQQQVCQETRTPYIRTEEGKSQPFPAGANRAERKTVELPTEAEIAAYSELLTTEIAVTQPHKQVKETEPMPAILGTKYWIMAQNEDLLLISIKEIHQYVLQQEIETKLTNGLVAQPLLMPVSLKADPDWMNTVQEREVYLKKLGIELSIRLGQLIIKKVPLYLRESQLAVIIPELLLWMRHEPPAEAALVCWLANIAAIPFTAPSEIWSNWQEIDTRIQREMIAKKAVSLPWQAWLKESESE